MDNDEPIKWDATRYRFEQIADMFAARIASGEMSPGDRLPAEDDIADQLGVAPMTVRRAVEELRDRGLVRTLRGRGTFVISSGPAT